VLRLGHVHHVLCTCSTLSAWEILQVFHEVSWNTTTSSKLLAFKRYSKLHDVTARVALDFISLLGSACCLWAAVCCRQRSTCHLLLGCKECSGTAWQGCSVAGKSGVIWLCKAACCSTAAQSPTAVVLRRQLPSCWHARDFATCGGRAARC
jgi:hypothetical protein